MANPKLPGISESEQALLYAKLNEYNRGRASFKEAGVYLVVLPRPGKPNYSLWLYSPHDRGCCSIAAGMKLANIFLSPARKAIDSLYTRFISGYQRVPADSKHHVLLFATVPHPDGLQREENAEQR